MTEQQKMRVFKYGDQSWEDPGQEFSNEDVRQQLTTVFPELARADIVTTDLPDGRVQVEFVKRAGTKGCASRFAETHVERFADALRPILDRYSGLPWELSTVSRMVCMALRDSGLELVTIEDANALREEEA